MGWYKEQQAGAYGLPGSINLHSKFPGIIAETMSKERFKSLAAVNY